MLYYFAPMEGLTDDLFRRLHHKYFPGVDRYYTPFISPATEGSAITRRDIRDVLPENNEGVPVIPQLLGNRADAFVAAAEILKELGYREVNLNLGCPSGTVCAKGKGAGFLARKEELRIFLDEIFEKSPIDVSVKTRLGKSDPEEFRDLLELYNRYPIRELTVHPRVQGDLYRHPVRMEWFDYARSESKAPLCLSGGIRVKGDETKLFSGREKPPALMLGRGLAANPGLVNQLRGQAGVTAKQLEEFHGELFEETAARLGNPRSTMFRMKEIWSYMILMFDRREKYQKLLRKTTSLSEFRAITAHIFRELPLREDADVFWN